jgi:hypothetical protein
MLGGAYLSERENYSLLILPYKVLIPVRLEPVETRVCFDKLSTNGFKQ